MREREIAFAQVGEGQRERGRDRSPSSLHAVNTEPMAGLKLTKGEIMT